MEAQRAGATVVVGEDLGTVQPEVTGGLAEHACSAATVLWFTRDEGGFLPPRRWPRNTLASISTHDLPTAARLPDRRARAGARRSSDSSRPGRGGAGAGRGRPAPAARHAARGGLLGVGADDVRRGGDGHARGCWRPARRASCSRRLYDVLGEIRQPNLPGTVDEYPNWRIPLSHSLDDLLTDPRVVAVARLAPLRDANFGAIAPKFTHGQRGHGDNGSSHPSGAEDRADLRARCGTGASSPRPTRTGPTGWRPAPRRPCGGGR